MVAEEVGLKSGNVYKRCVLRAVRFQADYRVSNGLCLKNPRIELYSSDYDNLHVV
jgi:hypothetical protein